MKIEVTFEGNKKIGAHINGHHIITDQSIAEGGENSAPTPFELFLASLATCAGIYIKGFCDSRNLPTDNIKLFQHVEFDKTTQMATHINLEIQVPPSFPENYRDTLVLVASKCKVKKHLQNPPEVKATINVI